MMRHVPVCLLLFLAFGALWKIWRMSLSFMTCYVLVSQSLSFFAKTLIEFDSNFPDDAGIMAALDEALSCLFKISTMPSCQDATRGVISAAGMEVFNAFLSIKLSCTLSSAEAEHFSDTFTMSHVSLLGHLGRSDPGQAAAALCLALETLQRRDADVEHQSAVERIQVQEGLWLVLKVINAFLADSCEGEKVSIPSCFAGNFMSESHPVLKLISTLMTFMQKLVPKLSVASPALVSALLEVFGTFMAVYVVTDESDGGGSYFFAHGGIALISCVLNSLRVFSFDEDVALAGCRVLEISVKSKGVVSILQASGLTEMAGDMVTCGQMFYEDVRGRIVGFWICCVSAATFSERGLSVLETFDIGVSEFTSVDVNICLERCSSLAGLFVSLQESERLRVCFRSVMRLCDHVLSVSVCRFYEKEITIRATELILRLFLTCSVVLDGEETVWMIDKVRTTLDAVLKTLAEDPTWSTEGTEEEKHRLLKLLSRLFCEVSCWARLECTLPSELVGPLGASVISSLAVFLKLFNERSLSFPELRESVFVAFQLSAEAFTRDFVCHADSQVFLSTLLFALNGESVDFQRVGITVADTVVAYLRDSGLQDHALFARLLSTVLRSFVLGKLSLSLSLQLARSLTTLCGCLPLESVELVFMEAMQLNSDPNVSAIMREMMRAVQECVVSEGPRRQTALRTLDECIADSLCNIRTILLD
ncbi:hypothetical protein TRSC58_00589 [Trypanosoma rangeli SC58]|uniref:Uncharacterized protein n=1 Tax=Trypanosoma rangeli SC58 TaxID=429131 RepID=A0A061JC48_TRYRA|nr:hypothetical protein TRSC58_00589 [Trypanosoma rangeli SC58]